MPIDDLDKKLLRYLSIGTGSYEELARLCNVTRNTVYRRIASLENRGIIKNTLNCVINLEQMDITPVTMGVTIKQTEEDQAINLLSTNKNVRFLWRTYGEHNITLIAFCAKGKEGEIIQGIRAILEQVNAEKISVSIGFVWEKMNYSAFDDQTEIEEKVERLIKHSTDYSKENMISPNEFK
jgi:DNA-binding Lrp family transcriptional regulator